MTELYTVKVENGNLIIHKTTGGFPRQICNGAASGVMVGDEVHVTMKDGKVKAYTVNGFFKRTLP